MRKITQEAINAFLSSEFRPFDKSYTRVFSTPSKRILTLFGRNIAIRKEGTKEIIISNAGWYSTTTKERLNGIPGVSISQKKGVWYLNGSEWDGDWQAI